MKNESRIAGTSSRRASGSRCVRKKYKLALKEFKFSQKYDIVFYLFL
ncbi:MAG: hypothetical protein ACRC0V_12185 [Fusobacteriaceae bacterium]